jgi:hypothetical protein
MAKNKVEIDVKVDDKGTTKKVGLEAKKASKGMDDLSKGARTADRNLKGAAQASSNATKNFSKMAQGTGGLVAAYATFAAQMFALSAAFGFFKRAGDLQVLQAGQKAYAAATGTAMKVLAQDIMEATDAQISFRDASQAAAIGVASGLNPDQLGRLGKAAKDVSAILGRDVTDSFNRLVKGVTKAEPELLDELGIVLRLKKATEDYGAAINKSADDLTAFERSQAVANEVLAQTEEKYSKILEITGGGAANQFNQLTVALDEVVMTIQTGLVPVANALAKVLTNMPILAGASFALLISGPLKAMGFNLDDIATKSRVAAFTQRRAFLTAQKQIQAATVDIKAQTAALNQNALAAAKTGAPGGSKLLQQVQAGGLESLTGAGQATLKRATFAATKHQKNGVITKGIYKGVAVSIVKDMQKAYTQIGLAGDKSVLKTEAQTSKIKMQYLKLSGGIQAIGSKAIAGFSKLIGIFGWIGMAVTIIMMLKDAFGFEKKLSDDEKAAERLKNRIKDLNGEMEHLLAIQKELTKEGSTSSLMNLGSTIGKQISSIGVGDDLTNTVALAQKGMKRQRIRPTAGAYQGGGRRKARRSLGKETSEETEATAFIQRQIDAMNLLEERSGISYSAFEKYKAALLDPNVDPVVLSAAASTAAELGALMSELPKQIETSDKGVTTFVNSFARLNQAEQAMKDIQTELESYTKLQEGGGLTSEQKERIQLLEKEHAFMKEINNAAHSRKINAMEAANEVERAGLIQTSVDKKIAQVDAKKEQAAESYINKQAEISELKKIILKDANKEDTLAEKQTPEQKRRLELLEEELEGLGIKVSLSTQIAQQANKEKEIRQELLEISQDIEILNTAKQLLDFENKKLNLAKQRVALEERNSNRELAKKKRDFKNSSPFSFLVQDKFNAAADLQQAKDLETAKIAQIEKERDMKIAMINMEYDLLDAKMRQTEFEMRLMAENPDVIASGRAARATKLADDIAKSRAEIGERGTDGKASTGLRNIAELLASDEAGSKIEDVKENILQLTDAKNDLSDISVLTDGIANSFASEMTAGLDGIITGTKSVKQAFGDMAIGILKMLAQMIAQMLAARILMSAFGLPTPPPGIASGGTTAPLTIPPGSFRYGGIAEPRGYSTGGIARGSQAGYPAILHGTEAVVPLPNGKSIPVEMNNSQATSNNSVVVNVAMGEGTSKQSQGESQGANSSQLGRLIAGAVQRELQEQQRPGGILSPYGAAR